MSGVKPVDVLWALPALVAAVVFVAWCALGLYEGAALGAACFACFALACAAVCALRGRVIARLEVLGDGLRIVRDAAILLAAGILSLFALELPWNAAMQTIPVHLVAVELLLILLTLVTFYFLNMRRGALPAVAAAAFLFIGLAQHFVYLFKGDCILPADLLALGTAATVAGGFEYTMHPACFAAIACAVAAVTLLSFVRPQAKPRGAKASSRAASSRLGRVGANVGVGVVLAAALFVCAGVVDYKAAFGVEFNYWWQMDYYQRQGFLPTFNYCNQDIVVKEPQGYTTAAAQRAQDELARAHVSDTDERKRREAVQAQFDELHPNIVVVMNESFTDLSTIPGLKGSYKGPEFFNERLDAFCTGALAVPVYGGGTANTEYEFFTGNSLTFLGAGKHPYEMFDLTKSSSVARQLERAGYDTLAVHPNLATNWNRDIAYTNLGIDRFDDIEAFDGAPVYNNGVTDKATYEYVLDSLKSNEAPQFVFDLTMQNHGGYLPTAIPAEDVPDIHPTGIDEETDSQLNCFLACIDASDRDLEWFVGELEQLDEPTVLLFFGDHHPSFSKTLNDALSGDEGQMDHNQRVYQTVYAMWANYELAAAPARKHDDMASSMLAACLLDSIGAPLTPFQQAQLGAREGVRTLDFSGYRGADGRWYWYEDGVPYATTVRALEWVTYRNYRTSHKERVANG